MVLVTHQDLSVSTWHRNFVHVVLYTYIFNTMKNEKLSAKYVVLCFECKDITFNFIAIIFTK